MPTYQPGFARTLLTLILGAVPLSGQYTISTIAGGGMPTNVSALTASFTPQVVALDPSSNLYAADRNTVYKITQTGIMTVFAGTGVSGSDTDGKLATKFSFGAIGGMAIDQEG